MIYYCIGDIHGMYEHLDRMLSEILKREPGIIVTLGDYIDRGPDSKKVLDRLMTFNEPGWQIVNLMGNHEDMLLSNEGYIWLMNGGQETLDSFGGHIPDEYFLWMQHLFSFYETKDYIFVHAGLIPGLTVDETPKQSKLWIRNEFLGSDYDWGKLVVHGHTPNRTIEERPNRLNIDTGACFYGYNTLTCAVLSGIDKPVEYIQVKKYEDNRMETISFTSDYWSKNYVGA